MLTDKMGIPLSIVLTAAAKTHDVKATIETLDNIVIKGRPTKKKDKQ
jgi:hypothetical protein